MRSKKSSRPLPAIVFRHVPHEGLGTIADALAVGGVPHRTIDIARGRPVLPPVSGIAGLIVMGGPRGVYEKTSTPFLRREVSYIRKVIAAGKPVLGICLGAQLVADALGARVYPNSQKEIGWYHVHLTAAGKKDLLMKGSPVSPWVFQWHGDTFDLPSGARRLATSPLCRNQAFRYGKNVYALQYHLEVDAAMVTNWLNQPAALKDLESVGPRARQNIKTGLSRYGVALARLGKPFFSGFVGHLLPKTLN